MQETKLAENPLATFRADCPCPKRNCPRHGYCEECKAYHAAKGKLAYCLREKTTLRDLLAKMFS